MARTGGLFVHCLRCSSHSTTARSDKGATSLEEWPCALAAKQSVSGRPPASNKTADESPFKSTLALCLSSSSGMSARESRRLVSQYLRACRRRASARSAHKSTEPSAQTIPFLSTQSSPTSPTIHVLIQTHPSIRPTLRHHRQRNHSLRLVCSQQSPSRARATLRQRRGAVTDLRAFSIQQANAPVGQRLRLIDTSMSAEEVRIYLVKALPLTPPDSGGTVDVQEILIGQGKGRFNDADEPLPPLPGEGLTMVEFRQVSCSSKSSAEIISTVTTGWNWAGAEGAVGGKGELGSATSPMTGSPTCGCGSKPRAGRSLRGRAAGLLCSLKLAKKRRRGYDMDVDARCK